MSYKKFIKKVAGKNNVKIMLFALSTCGWCRKTKNLLNELGVEYDYVDVDLLEGADRDEAYDTMSRYNKAGGFPTIVINDKDCIVGFEEEKLRHIVKIGK
jgi:glutaredoxin-like protein NrdH